MNTLSWFIYLIGVVPAIGVFALKVSLLSAIGMVIIVGAHVLARSECYNQSSKNEFDEKTAPLFRYWRKVFLSIFCVAVPIFILIPNQKTMILIGASEFGEKMLSSDKAQRLIDPSYQLLETWINKELAKLKEETVQKK
jgi:hypothetical protein